MTAAPPPPSSDWAFFFDIDGTLSELVATPALARIAPELLQRIGALVRQTDGAVAVVSGRTLHDIDVIFRGMRIPAAGQHGAEWRDATGNVTRLERSALLGAERDALADIVSRHAGLMLEDKGLTFALHYRAAPQLASFAHRLVRAAQRRLGPAYTVQGGKRLVELVPDSTNKGIAIQSLMKQSPFRGRTPVFLGDDVTDEHAFTAVDALGGHSIKVGPGRSAARWRLPSVDAVSSWIGQALTVTVAATDSSTTVDA